MNLRKQGGYKTNIVDRDLDPAGSAYSNSTQTQLHFTPQQSPALQILQHNRTQSQIMGFGERARLLCLWVYGSSVGFQTSLKNHK